MPAFRDYFSLNTSVSGRYDLIINSTNKSHAGRYFCSEDSDTAVSAEVTIIGEHSHNLAIYHVNSFKVLLSNTTTYITIT